MIQLKKSTFDGIVRAFWRRIEMYKNDFEAELPETLPIEFVTSFSTALTLLDDEILVWRTGEPVDNLPLLVKTCRGNHYISFYNDVQKTFYIKETNEFITLNDIDKWTPLSFTNT